jgi:hypothetical protein
MYQQSSLLVTTFTPFGMSVGPHRLFAVVPQYSGLINNLIVTTDRLIMGSRTAPSSRSSSQGAKPRISPAPLAWAVALRASRDITIQASIEYVLYLLLSSHLSDLVLRIGRSRECIDLTDEPSLMNLFSSRILA